MAVLKISTKLAPEQITYDSRFRAWAKLVSRPEHVALDKANGYSLSGPFVNWGKAVAVGAGQFVVLAAESGSRNNHTYTYALVRVNGSDEPEVVSDEEIAAAVAAAPDEHRAKAINSQLYAFAVYCARAMAAPSDERAAHVAAAREALLALTEGERAALFAELAESVAA